MGVPEGSCGGTGSPPTPSSVQPDAGGRDTGVCPVCGGRFRLGSERLPNHAPPGRSASTIGSELKH